MKEFRLDKDHFMQQLRELQKAGDEYTEAKRDLSGAVSIGCKDLQISGACSASGDDESSWSRLNELQQFRTPVHTSMMAISKEMEYIAGQQQETIANLRASLDAFEYSDQAERIRFVKALDKLGRQFTYNEPESLKAIDRALKGNFGSTTGANLFYDSGSSSVNDSGGK